MELSQELWKGPLFARRLIRGRCSRSYPKVAVLSEMLALRRQTGCSTAIEVAREDFMDASLIVFGHGSTLNEHSGAPVFQHAAELRRRGLFKEVREAFWKQQPPLTEVIAAASASRVFLAPLFISDGYFSEQMIPEALGFRDNSQATFKRTLRRRQQTLFYCRAVGSHPAMTKVIIDRARNVLKKFPFPRRSEESETTLFLAGHGTEQNRHSRAAIDLQVARLRDEKMFAEVHGVFLDEEPRVSECFVLCKTRNMIVVPFFISEGMHVQEDIPVLLGEAKRVVQQRLAKGAAVWRNPTEKKGKRVWYTESVGTDPMVADLILERVREAAQENSNIE